jgi:hypothetical protein
MRAQRSYHCGHRKLLSEYFAQASQRLVAAAGLLDAEVRLLTSLTISRPLATGRTDKPTLEQSGQFPGMDTALERCARQANGKYTRYADDLVFSWPEGANHPPISSRSSAPFCASRLPLHPRKGWRVWRRADEPEVTGLILRRRGEVDLPDSMRCVMKLLAASDDPGDQRRLTGYRGYESMIRRRV